MPSCNGAPATTFASDSEVAVADSLLATCEVLSFVDEEADVLLSDPQPANTNAENENTAIPTINFFAFIMLHLLLIIFPQKSL